MPFSESLHLDSVSLSTLSSIYLYSNAIWLLPAGILLDYFSSKKLLCFFMLLAVLSSFALAVSSSFSIDVLLRIIQGASSAFSLLGVLRVAHRCYPKQAGTAVGWMIAVGMLGGIVGNTLFTPLLDYYNWQIVTTVNGVVGLVFLALMMIGLPDLLPSHERVGLHSRFLTLWQQLKSVLTNLNNVKLGLYIGSMNLPVFVLAALWGNLYLLQAKGVTSFEASMITAQLFFGQILGSPFYGWLSDKLGSRRLPMRWGAIFSLLIIFAIVFIPHQSVMVLAIEFFLLGVAIMAQVVAYPALAEGNRASMGSTATGFGSLISNLTGAVAQMLFGYLLIEHHVLGRAAIMQYSPSQFGHAMWVLIGAFVLSLVLSFWAKETMTSR